MLVVKPKVELWLQGNGLSQFVAQCARICYASDKGNDERLVQSLIDKKHNSMFRHATYYIITNSTFNHDYLVHEYNGRPGFSATLNSKVWYITVNGHWAIDYPGAFDTLKPYIVPVEQFSNTEIGFNMMRYTFWVRTQISTSRELNRVSPNNISEQSTRYVNFNKKGDVTVCQPWWFNIHEDAEYYEYRYAEEYFTHYVKSPNDANWHPLNNTPINLGRSDYYGWMAECWLLSNYNSANAYAKLVDKGMKPQDARGVLGLDVATTCIYTYSIKEWRDIIDKRVYQITGPAHPNAIIVCDMIRNKLMELGHEFRDRE